MAHQLVRAGLLLAALTGAASAEPVNAIDSLGRSVALAAPARRILLAAGRDLPALALIDKDVATRIVGIGQDLRRQSPDVWRAYERAYPRLAELPVMETGPGGFPAERAIALGPDLVILGRTQAGSPDADGSTPLLRALGAAGIAAAVIDFHEHPLRDTAPAMRALGRLLGREREADEFNAFVAAHLAAVAVRLRGARDAPVLFLHTHAGAMACCFSPGQGTFNDDILAAGGRNAAAPLLPGATGQISPEALLSLDPTIYVATGGAHLADKGGLVLGDGVDRAAAHTALEAILRAPGLAPLSAVKAGRAYGLWHGFSTSPLNVLAVEVMAKWLHPELMEDVDPARTLAEINARFLAVPMDGAYWVALR
ncbi:iron complex transport system substrate-binding protein [Methylobacterium sp. PvP105]|nr:iron complex transport system substrate-binding protein [Methylobacterium sp. PvP105]